MATMYFNDANFAKHKASRWDNNLLSSFADHIAEKESENGTPKFIYSGYSSTKSRKYMNEFCRKTPDLKIHYNVNPDEKKQRTIFKEMKDDFIKIYKEFEFEEKVKARARYLNKNKENEELHEQNKELQEENKKLARLHKNKEQSYKEMQQENKEIKLELAKFQNLNLQKKQRIKKLEKDERITAEQHRTTLQKHAKEIETKDIELKTLKNFIIEHINTPKT